jgi:hypothetical protein
LSDRLGKAQPQRLLALQNCTDKAFVQRMQAHAEGDLQTPRSPRQILEWWGSEYRREQDQAYWVKHTLQRINHYRSHNCTRPIVLADVYKRNEAEMIRSLGGTIWRIERTAHATNTEHLQIQADLTLHNMGDIKHLQHLVLTSWHELKRYGHHAAVSTAP